MNDVETSEKRRGEGARGGSMSAGGTAIIRHGEADFESMRRAGRLAAETLDFITPHVTPGTTTEILDQLCHDFVDQRGAISAPLGYRNFPKSICTSVNHVVCHGIPGEKKLKVGDAINIDVTVIKDGFHGDTSRMFFAGKANVQAKRLAEIAFESMWLGIEELAPGKRLGDIGAAVQKHVEKHRFSVVREYCGHGIGEGFHEDPQVLHFGKRNTGLELREGMTLTVEPMVNAGKANVRLLPDGWTVVTKDHSLSAQWEHTLLITKNGFEALTLGRADR